MTGYGYNYQYLSPFSTFDYVTPMPPNLSEVSEPARTVAFGTSAELNTWSFATPTVEGNPFLDPPSSAFPGFQGRHNGFGNVLWCDGHVKTFKPIYRTGTFGYGYNAADFSKVQLGDIDQDGNLATDELFSLEK